MSERKPPESPAGDQGQQVKLDDSSVSADYANFCRISGTPEELVLDFALNTQPSGTMPETLKLNQRVILNFYTAKRLLIALQMAVQRHEQMFGVLETDIRKRVSPQQPK
jgi:hypothetical protein